MIASACASPGTPPGGPVDTQAPQVVRIVPDSGRTGVSPRSVVFHFDEVVSERPAGVASLSALFLISPRDGEPRVSWSRREVVVRPRRGWRPSTAYTVTLLPGISDLRGNIRNSGATTVFATGAVIPAGRISGTLFNWTEGRILQRGLVQARPLTDTSIVYVTATDSAGNFTIAHLPGGQYRVLGISDDNSNRALDPREAWDSVTVPLTDTARLELLAFVHDSVGSRLLGVNYRDSVTLELLFDNPLSVSAPLGPAGIRVRAPDSTDVSIASVAPPERDTTPSIARRPSRPPPAQSVIVRLSRPLRAETEYRVTVTDARNLIGIARSSEQTVRTPAPARPPGPAPPPPSPPRP